MQSEALRTSADFRTATIVIAASAGTSLLSLVFVGYVARTINFAEYADFAAAVAVATLLGHLTGPFALLAARESAVLAGRGASAQMEALDHAVRKRFMTFLLPSLPFAAAAVWLLSSSLNFQSWMPLSVAFLMATFMTLLGVSRGVMRGNQRYSAYSASIAIEALLRLLVGVAVLWLFESAGAALLAYVAASSMVLFTLHRRTESHASIPVEVDMKALLPLLLLVTAVALAQSIDTLAAKRLLTPEAAAAYAAAASLARAATIVLLPVDVLLVPGITYWRADAERLRKVIRRLALIGLALASLPLLIFGSVGREIVTLIFGETYSGGANLILPLGISFILSTLVYLCGQALTAFGRNRFLIFTYGSIVIELVALAAIAEHPIQIAWVVATVQAASFVIHVIILGRAFAAEMRHDYRPA